MPVFTPANRLHQSQRIGTVGVTWLWAAVPWSLRNSKSTTTKAATAAAVVNASFTLPMLPGLTLLTGGAPGVYGERFCGSVVL
jgi:hypothetical protein